MERKSVLVLGTFDGVHKGHRELFKQAKRISDQMNMTPVILTFDCHPRELLGKEVRLLTLNEERLAMLRNSGLECRVLPFTAELSQMSPEEYIAFICTRFNAGGLLAGSNHTFGRGALGTLADIVRLADKYGYKTFIIPPLCQDGERISSTLIRNKLFAGDVDGASALLGYDYFIAGKVSRGCSLGHTLGYPTANLEYSDKKLVPARGVYVTRTRIGNRDYQGMTNIGVRPTVSDSGVTTIETFLFDAEANLYGRDIRVSFIKRIREERKFDSTEALAEQLHQDELISRAYLSARDTLGNI